MKKTRIRFHEYEDKAKKQPDNMKYNLMNATKFDHNMMPCNRANSVLRDHGRSADGKRSVRFANQLHNNVVPGFKIITFKCIRDYAISIFLSDNRCLASFCSGYNRAYGSLQMVQADSICQLI